MAPPRSVRSKPDPLAIGAVLEQRYLLDGLIGRGGMGIVLRAFDLVQQRPVAIKVINLAEGVPGAREKFLREAQITLQLKHPHIVEVYAVGAVDIGTPEPAPFIAMELVEGENLDRMRHLTIAQVIELGRQICGALAYAHEQGFVHRDLKPENVLVAKRGFGYVAKLADFGLARPRDISQIVSERIEGTVYFMAPEVIEGQIADVPADLYALGAMLYQMVTGDVPFSDFDAQAILTQHVEQAVIPPHEIREGVPPALEKIILRLLEKKPRDRFESATRVLGALEQVAATLEPSAPPDNLPRLESEFADDEDETLQIKTLLESSPLVTLLGDSERKSLLALATGAKLIEEFSDGIWVVELGTIKDPARVPSQIAAILGVKEKSDRTLIRALIEFLEEKNALIILDQCDHLRGACAQFAETILRTCPTVRLLATSRQPLNLPGEMRYTLR